MYKIYALIICLTLVFLPSCAEARYTDAIDCSAITDAIRSKILTPEPYSEYQSEDIAFMLDYTDKFDSYSIIYSTSSDDIGEVGVFHAISQEESLELVEDIAEYLNDIKEEKGAFVRNYLQGEEEKLDAATVKRFGNYVVFTVLEPSKSNAVFAQIEKTLK